MVNSLFYRSMLGMLLMLMFSAAAHAQNWEPRGFTFVPNSILQGDCYGIVVDDGYYMTIDILVLFPGGGGPLEADQWVTLDGAGQYSGICTPYDQPVGTYTVEAVRNSYYGDWVYVWSSIEVLSATPPPPPPDPAGISFSRPSMGQGECLQVTVGDGANMLIGIQYIDPVYGAVEQAPWMALDSNGTGSFCSDQSVGSYTVTAIRNMQSTVWIPTSATFEIVAQPSDLSISPTWGYAGILSGYGSSCKTLTFAGAPNSTVDMLLTQTFAQGTVQGEWGPHTLDANGQWSNCDGHDSTPHTLTVLAIKNVDAINWRYLPVPQTWQLMPPQPSGLSFGQTMVHPGEWYTWFVGNGGNTTLDVVVTVNDEAPWTGTNYLPLDADGLLASYVPPNQPLGHYHVTAIKNTLNPEWLNVDASIDVCLNSVPAVNSVQPAARAPGDSGTISLHGSNLCDIRSVAISPEGFIHIDHWHYTNDGTSISANLWVDANAPVGPVLLTLITGNGNAQFQLDIRPSPVVWGISTSGARPGNFVQVSLSGAYLEGAYLSTSWPGLSFSNVSSTSNSISAIFNIAAEAKAGTPEIVVSNNSGSTTTSLFSILGPLLSREYIYLGDRLLAVDGP